jgi:NADPH-dependent 2,4-dienoyl-CoA reductase/sulfur reductase-like enzyme
MRSIHDSHSGEGVTERVTRRDLLKTGAIATTALGALAARPQPAAARSLQADYIVVGAGCAGLGAAWELFKRGHSVLVLEATGRVGGRVWSANLSDGSLFEIGGSFLNLAGSGPGQAEQFRVAPPGAGQMADLIVSGSVPAPCGSTSRSS